MPTDPDLEVTEAEAAVLIHEATIDNVLTLPYVTGTLRLVDVPGNAWAIRRLAELRGEAT